MKKILFLTTQFPYPLDNGGKIGAFNGLKVVSKYNYVTVLSFAENDKYIEEGVKYYNELLPNVTFVTPVIHDIHIRGKKFKLAKAILEGIIKDIPYAVSKFENKSMYMIIDSYMKGNKWDLIFIDYINMSNYGRYIRKKYRDCFDYYIFKNHNKEYELVEQEACKYKDIRKFILVNDAKRTWKFETEDAKNADLVYSVCDDNTDFLKQYNINAYSMLPTYDNIEAETVIKNNVSRKILYIGGLSWDANIKGLKWFVEKVFPLVRSKNTDATLTIVGGGLNENPFQNNEGIEYLGYIKELNDIYLDKSVFIVPLFEGSGIRIKILEAFQNELPVVSTSIGCDTIGAKHKEEIMIADNEYDFAESIDMLINDEMLNFKIRNNAKQLLLNKFSLQKRQEEFEKHISTLYL